MRPSNWGQPTPHLTPIEAAWAEVARLRGLLSRLEWAGPLRTCPACDYFSGSRHAFDCWLAKELGLETTDPKGT